MLAKQSHRKLLAFIKKSAQNPTCITKYFIYLPVTRAYVNLDVYWYSHFTKHHHHKKTGEIISLRNCEYWVCGLQNSLPGGCQCFKETYQIFHPKVSVWYLVEMLSSKCKSNRLPNKSHIGDALFEVGKNSDALESSKQSWVPRKHSAFLKAIVEWYDILYGVNTINKTPQAREMKTDAALT
jgi:hypothetical protein